MIQYLTGLKKILDEGQIKHNRTGIDTISTFFIPFEHHMKDGFPLLTTKKVYFDGILGELLWFLTGSASIKGRYEKYLKFWEPWADKNGNVPSPYGNFWRHYPLRRQNGLYSDTVTQNSQFLHFDENISPFFDQIGYVLDQLKTNPTSRRLVVMAWEPQNAIYSNLPPCHYTFVVNVGPDNELNLHWTQRSCDFPVGVPFNIASYALLLLILAKKANLRPGKLAASFLDAHIYVNQVDGVKEQLLRTPKQLPTVEIDEDKITSSLKLIPPCAIHLLNYDPDPKIVFPVAV